MNTAAEYTPLTLPKVELHVHLEGTATPEFWRKLLLKNKSNKPVPSLEELQKRFAFKSFLDFGKAFKDVAFSLRAPEDFYHLTRNYLHQTSRENVKYCEMMCTPWFFTRRGMDYTDLMSAIDQAAREVENETGIEMKLILDGPRNFMPEAVMEVFEMAVRDKTGRVIGVGLGGDEKNYPARLFVKEFEFARAHGLKTIAHAGETDGEQSMIDAIELLGVTRIGHCLGIPKSSRLEELILEKGVTLDLCPWSNVATQSIDSIFQHPLADYVQRGYSVTLNSDDPGFFKTSITKEFQTAADIFHLSNRQLAEITLNAINGSFLPEAKKQTLRKLVA